jgi:hypothetical protein
MPITGTWWNELNSKMVIQQGRDRRQISGTYHTSVGKARAKKYPLVGRCDASGNKDQLVSWVVVWDPPDPPAKPSDPPNKPSITAWTGQYHVDEVTGVEFITTTWLLTRMTSAAEDWTSTRMSMDVFFRKPPSPKAAAIARRLGKAASHFTEPVSGKRSENKGSKKR